MRRILSLYISILSLVPIFGFAQGSFEMAFWNVENLFDTTDAAGINDDDFTPSGRYAWTEEHLSKKIDDLKRVISDLDQNGSLKILGLSEIENREVLERLNTRLGMGYEVIHKESPDERGIDCALLFRPSDIKLAQTRFIPVHLAGDEKTRDILEAQFVDPSGEKLVVFVNHWPSRWGGQAETDPLRRRTADILRKRVDILLRSDPGLAIVIMGDFNDYPVDPSLRSVLRAKPPGTSLLPGELINTTWPIYIDPEQGTIMYRGDWVVLDQIIISPGLLLPAGFTWALNSTKVFRPDYLLEDTGKYAGWPYRMHRSGRYQGGYSDHLPVSCRITY